MCGERDLCWKRELIISSPIMIFFVTRVNLHVCSNLFLYFSSFSLSFSPFPKYLIDKLYVYILTRINVFIFLKATMEYNVYGASVIRVISGISSIPNHIANGTISRRAIPCCDSTFSPRTSGNRILLTSSNPRTVHCKKIQTRLRFIGLWSKIERSE